MPYITREDDISVLSLSSRAHNCLKRADIHTVGAMMDYPPEELMNIRNMGQKSTDEIQKFVQAIKEGTSDYVLVEAGGGHGDNATTQGDIDADGFVTVFVDSTGGIVNDLSVNDLQLSVRAKNCLVRGGYQKVSQLVGMTHDDLMNIRNMGKKTAEEVLSYIDQISVSHVLCSEANENKSPSNELAVEMHDAFGETESAWLREVMTVKEQYPEVMGETLIYRFYDSVFVRGTVKTKIISIIENNGNEISKAQLEKQLPQHLSNTTIIEEILLELEAVSAVEIGEVMIRRQYPSAVEFVAQIENDRIREVVQGRLDGKTLNEIGEQFGITRERVRQLMLKGLRDKPILREDKYTYIYDHYDFSYEDFALAFDEPRATYNYLEMISPITRAKRQPLDSVLTDSLVSPEFRKKAERAIFKNYITENGVRVKKTRPTMVKHFVRTRCKSLIKFEEFIIQYHLWLEELGLGDNLSLKTDARSYENRLNQSDYVLWNQWKSFRYYNIPEYDYEELLSTLNLSEYEDTEISSLKLFRDYPELMKQYDIRDEYELHNLLKKIWTDTSGKVNFGRMPTIEIGTMDRNKQVLSLLLQHAPISGEDFAERYEEAYGVKASTVLANYMAAFAPYYYDGIYSVDYSTLPAIQFDRMKAILYCDYYTIQEVKRLYKREFPHSDESLINPYTLKVLGFRVYSGYIVNNIYPSAVDYFRHLLTTDDIVDARSFSKSIQSIGAYSSELYKLRADYDIVEFSPLQYINIRRLNAAGVTIDDFRNYCKAVSRIYEKGEYFTVTSLRNDGFSHEMDDLGFDEWFYSSVLLEDRELFSYQRVGGTRIFLCGKADATLGGMLEWILEKYQKIDFYDLKDLLDNYYGVVLPKDKILTIIGGTELYYDTIMEAVYIDYDTYFEEI